MRAFGTARITTLDGEPVSSAVFSYEPETLHERAYRVECGECGAVLFERAECPRCGGGGGLQRALGRQHGPGRLAACPRCEHPELKVTAEARMHAVFIEGRPSRRVVDSEPHEPGFHVSAIDCPSCEATVARAGDDCVLCGRSSLLLRRR